MPSLVHRLFGPTTMIASAAASVACVVPDLDLDDKQCPCLAGYICDDASNTCRRSGASETGSGSETSSGTTSTTTGDDDSSGGVDGLFEVVAFRAEWSTPNAIYWTWDVQGDAGTFHEYRLLLATSEADLRARDGVTIVDSSINPELGFFTLPNAGGSDRVSQTLTLDLSPSTTYYAQLEVVDTGGGVSMSPNMAVKSTGLQPVYAVTIFDDAFASTPGLVLPSCYAQSMEAPAEDSAVHFEWLVRCLDVGGGGASTCDNVVQSWPVCWENLRWEDMSIALTDAVSFGPGAFERAYVEFFVAIDASGADSEGPTHGWWADAGITLEGGLKSFPRLTYRSDGAYRRYQIKLSEFGAGLGYEDFEGSLDGFRVGTQWAHGALVRVDEVRIRW